MQARLDPPNGAIDHCPRIIVDGLAPGTPVTVTVSTTDAAGHRWRSAGRYPTGPDGELTMSDPERPWWDMTYTDTNSAPVTFSAPDGELRYQVDLEAAGQTTTVHTSRRWNDGATVRDLAGDGWRLRVFVPPGGGSGRAVLIIPGSTGVAAVAPTAALLAGHGLVAAVLGYMQDDDLPASFRQIPVEAVLAGVAAFTALSEVDAGSLTVLAQSVGTGLALSALSDEAAPSVRSVVLVAPTHVVWQALGAGGPPPKASSLSRGGADLPYVKLRGEKLLGQMVRAGVGGLLSRRPRSRALRMHDAYATALADRDAVVAAGIPAERIAAPMLIIAGTDDAMWPSATMAAALHDRRGHRADDRLLLLHDAGHFLRPPCTPTTVDRNDALISGGTPTGVARGQRAAWNAILGFIDAT